MSNADVAETGGNRQGLESKAVLSQREDEDGQMEDRER